MGRIDRASLLFRSGELRLNMFLKDSVRPAPYWFFCVSLVAIHAALFLGLNNLPSLIDNLTDSPVKAAISFLVLIGVNILPRPVRNSIAHFKLRHPLPSSEAFSRWGKSDHRISMDKIKTKIGTIPRSPDTQSKTWYSELYQKVKREQEVVEAQKKYLLFRDLAILQFGALLFWIGAGIVFAPVPLSMWAILLGGYVLLVVLTRNSGVNFVQQVMAVSQ